MKRLRSRLDLEGFAVDVSTARFRRGDGTEVDRQVVEHPGSVAILAHDEEFAYLVAQPREAVGEDRLFEIPAGTLDVEGESALECAQRELAEEAELAAEAIEIVRLPLAEPGAAPPKLRDATTLVALLLLRDDAS